MFSLVKSTSATVALLVGLLFFLCAGGGGGCIAKRSPKGNPNSCWSSPTKRLLRFVCQPAHKEPFCQFEIEKGPRPPASSFSRDQATKAGVLLVPGHRGCEVPSASPVALLTHFSHRNQGTHGKMAMSYLRN